MTVFDHNLRALRSKYPALRAELRHSRSQKLRPIQTRSGLPSATWEGVYVHSKYDPKREAAGVLKEQDLEGITAAVFFGFGLGYMVECFLDLHPGIPALVVEPDMPFFLAALASRDLTHIICSDLVDFLIGTDPDPLAARLEQLPAAGLHVVRLRSVYDKDKDFYEHVDTLLQSFAARKLVNISTMDRFGKLWVRNLFQNVDILLRFPGVRSLEGLFQGIPALTLSAGPSLDEVLPSIQALKQRMLLVAVDTALKPCLACGVEPDFLLVVDPQYWNTRHVDTPIGNVTTILEPATHPRVKRFLSGNGFLTGSFFPLGQYFEEIVGTKGQIGAGGSVSTTAWDFTRFLGIERIYMAGLDLGFPGKKTHCQGTFLESLWYEQANRTESVETRSFNYIHDAFPTRICSNAEESLLCDKRMLIYRSWFEAQMRLHPCVKTYTLARHGAKIAGMPYLDLPSLLDLPLIRPLIMKRLQRVQELLQMRSRASERRALQRAMQDLSTDLQKLERCAAEGSAASEDLERALMHEHDSGPYLARLADIDARILGLSSRNVAGFLLQPFIHRTIDNYSKRKTAEQIVAESKTMYAELREATSFHSQKLAKSLKVIPE